MSFTPQPTTVTAGAYIVEVGDIPGGESRTVSIHVQAERYGYHDGTMKVSADGSTRPTARSASCRPSDLSGKRKAWRGACLVVGRKALCRNDGCCLASDGLEHAPDGLDVERERDDGGARHAGQSLGTMEYVGVGCKGDDGHAVQAHVTSGQRNDLIWSGQYWHVSCCSANGH